MDIKEIEKLLENAYFRDTYEKIGKLSGEAKERFQQNLAAVLENDDWLSFRGFNDSNYNRQMIEIVLYNEMFEKDFSYLHRN